MALEADFLQLTNQTITVAPLSTVDGYGAPTFGTSVSYSAYVEPGTFMTLNAQGVEERAVAMIYVLSSSATIGTQDRLTLPDARVPKIIRVDVLNDEEGQHHLEVAVG